MDHVLKIARNFFRRLFLRLRSREAIFARYHATNFWGGKASVSGQGSDEEQTRVVRRELPRLLRELNVRSMLDAPCGDFHWMKDVALPVKTYIGAEIVPVLVEMNQKKYGDATHSFIFADIVRTALPKVDLIFVRDALVHLANAEALEAIRNMKRSGATYLLATTFPGHGESDIVTGEWRPMNLEASPFNFPKPLQLINEECTENHCQYKDKSLGLWSFSSILSS